MENKAKDYHFFTSDWSPFRLTDEDVEGNQFLKEYVANASDKSKVIATNRFKPDTKLFRDEVKTLIARLFVYQKKELNTYEQIWSQTQRSMALDTAKLENVKGGFLKIRPNDQESVENSEVSYVSEANGKEMRDVKNQRFRSKKCRDQEVNENAEMNKDNFQDICVDDNLIPKRKRRRNKSTEEHAQICIPLPTVTDQSDRNDLNEVNVEEFRTTVMGTNDRKVKILFEGGGDYTREFSTPKRRPFYLNLLSKDQQDLVFLQVQEYEQNKRNYSRQTDPVVILGGDADFNFLRKEGRAPCKCDESITLIKKTNEKI
ncbi:hypothetical protein ACF0H5_013096 [Mactra antiquata]